RLIAEYATASPLLPGVGHGLLTLFRSVGDWQRIVDFVPTLPADMAQQPNIIELFNLARSELGDNLQAIAALEALIAGSAATSEREGLLGGRYKRLWGQATDEADKRRYLNEAIRHYERGMMLDLNDFYPSSNLPRLYRARGSAADVEKARAVAQAVYFAC